MHWISVCRANLGRIWGIALIAAVAAACASPVDTTTLPPPPPQLTGPAPFLVSNAITTESASLLGEGGYSGPVAYVSLLPGTLPGATVANIRVDRTGRVVSAALIDGGLDPVAVEAVAGDTISLTLQLAAGGTSSFRFTVPARKPPVIVRTVPPKNKRDVPLNARMTVVFSEPIDAASLTPQNFELRAGSNIVAGQLAFANAEHTAVEFTPDADLVGGTTYELVVGQGITDRDGTPLEEPDRVPFTTSTLQLGGLVITTATTGIELAPTGYSVSVDGGDPKSIAVAGSITVGGLVSGSHTVTLIGLGASCTVVGANVRNIALASGATATVAFAITCAANTVRQLAFVRDGHIYRVNLDGTGLLQLTTTAAGVKNADPAWSPDGTRIAFSSNRGGRPGSVIDGREAAQDIYVMNADGLNVVQRTSTGWYNGQPAWSPDGRRIAFTSYQDHNYDVYSMSAENNERVATRLTNSPGNNNVFPAWSPDGSVITFTGESGHFDYFDLHVMNADGSGRRTLIDGSLLPNGYFRQTYFQSAWSPDGSRIAVVRCGYTGWDFTGIEYSCGAENSEVAIVDADGSGLTVVAWAGGLAKPTWAHDGRMLAFSLSNIRDSTPSIRFVHADGSAEGLIVANGHSPAWRP